MLRAVKHAILHSPAYTASSVNVGWYNGNGDGRIVVVKADDNVWTDEDNAIAAFSSRSYYGSERRL